jgi:hypothetical protein
MEAARQHTVAALATLHEIATNVKQPAAARVAASTALLDRAWGKPSQSVEVSGPGGGPVASVAITTSDPMEAARAYQKLIKGE